MANRRPGRGHGPQISTCKKITKSKEPDNLDFKGSEGGNSLQAHRNPRTIEKEYLLAMPEKEGAKVESQ